MNNFNVSDEFNENIEKTLQEEINIFEKKIETLQEELIEKVKPTFQKLLTIHNIESYRWTQYTPYFNDGDECIFSVNSYGVEILHDGEFVEEWNLTDENENLKIILDKLEDFLESIPSNIMKTMFGDHVEITVMLEGIDIDEYEHD